MVNRLKLYDKIVKLKKNGFIFAEKLEEEARVVVGDNNLITLRNGYREKLRRTNQN